MGVSRSAYYAWLERPQTAIEKDDIELVEIIKSLFQKGRKNYGTRRLKKALLSQGRRVSRRRIGRLMAAAGLACKTKRKFIATTNSNHKLPIAPNHLDRQFTASQPNQTYVGDITYIHTLEGWLHLAVVIDLYSRQVVGWSMAERVRPSRPRRSPRRSLASSHLLVRIHNENKHTMVSACGSLA